MKAIAFSLGSLMSLFAATPALAAPALGATSSNWSGYAADTGTYTGIGASWVVPTASSTDALAADAEWVGVGGSASDDLIQAGTEAIVENGNVSYKGWYELLPDGQDTIPLVLHAGDAVTVSLTEEQANDWRLSFTDATTGDAYVTDLTYASSHSSAEWILESPLATTGARSALVPLDQFGSVTFSNAFTIEDGVRESVSAANAQAITMARGEVALAAPSTLADDSFSVDRTDAAVTAPSSTRFYRASGRGAPFPVGRRVMVVWVRASF